LFLRSARYPQMPRFLQFLREFWPMPLPLMNHSALALFAQRTRIPTSARSIGFCVIWVCISSSSSSRMRYPTCQQLPWRPAHGHTCDVASTAKKPIEEVVVDVKEAQATKNRFYISKKDTQPSQTCFKGYTEVANLSVGEFFFAIFFSGISKKTSCFFPGDLVTRCWTLSFSSSSSSILQPTSYKMCD